MKTTHVCLAIVMGAMICSTSVFAQENPAPQRRQLTPEQRIERQVERMEKELLLDDETAAKFAPIYKEYLQTLSQCCGADACKKDSCPKGMSDEELDKMMQHRFECQKKRIETEEAYYKKFKEILTIRQVEKLFNSKPQRQQRHCRQAPQMKSGQRPPMHQLVR